MLRQLPPPPTGRLPVSALFHRGTAPSADAPSTAAALRPGHPTAAETTRAAAPDRAPARLTERNA